MDRVIRRVAIQDLSDAFLEHHALAGRASGHVRIGERIEHWPMLRHELGERIHQVTLFRLEPGPRVVRYERSQAFMALLTQVPGPVERVEPRIANGDT